MSGKLLPGLGQGRADWICLVDPSLLTHFPQDAAFLLLRADERDVPCERVQPPTNVQELLPVMNSTRGRDRGLLVQGMRVGQAGTGQTRQAGRVARAGHKWDGQAREGTLVARQERPWGRRNWSQRLGSAELPHMDTVHDSLRLHPCRPSAVGPRDGTAAVPPPTQTGFSL